MAKKEQNTYEFSGNRSRSYRKALAKFPDVWEEDMLVMRTYLAPEQGENILEVGAGSGFFSFEISKMIGACKRQVMGHRPIARAT